MGTWPSPIASLMGHQEGAHIPSHPEQSHLPWQSHSPTSSFLKDLPDVMAFFSPTTCRIGENASVAAIFLNAPPRWSSLQNYCPHFADESTETQQVNELLKLMPGRQILSLLSPSCLSLF